MGEEKIMKEQLQMSEKEEIKKEQTPIKIHIDKFSYSKLSTYVQCPFQYYLKYVKKNYYYKENLAAEFGTLVHFIEETIAKNIMQNIKPNYDELKKMFLEINIPKKNPRDADGGIFGINILKEKYKDEFYDLDVDKKCTSYFLKSEYYYYEGIYRLENFMNDNPNLMIVDVEKYFEINYNNVIFYGYIDRILKNKITNEYIIEDIKTKDKVFEDKDLTTPLQFVLYSIAIKNAFKLDYYPETCYYDLPIINQKQKAGTKKFIDRGIKKIGSTLESIYKGEWAPKASPLCYWCDFCPNNIEKLEEKGKNVCCYYSLWTEKDNRNFNKACEWKGIENHEKVLNDFFDSNKTPGEIYKDSEFDFKF